MHVVVTTDERLDTTGDITHADTVAGEGEDLEACDVSCFKYFKYCHFPF